MRPGDIGEATSASGLDLALATEFDFATAEANIQAVRPGMQIYALSSRTREGIDDLLNFLQHRADAISQSRAISVGS